MNNQVLCDNCKTSPAIIHIEGRGDYCLKCHNALMLDRFGIDDTFNYAEYMSVVEPGGEIHTFKINHIILGGIVAWEATEQGGDYYFKKISNVNQNGAEIAKQFFKKIVNGVLTKSLEECNFPVSNVCQKDGHYYSLKEKGTISIVEDEDDSSKIYFVIDGKQFTIAELGELFATHAGFNIQYKIQDESDSLLKENEYLEPVAVTAESLISELKVAITISCDAGGFLSYNQVSEFDDMFFPITDKLEILMKSSHRDEAIQTGQSMIELLVEIDTDDDFFPVYECDLIKQIIERMY